MESQGHEHKKINGKTTKKMGKDARESTVNKFHKSTILLAEKLVGASADKFATFPFVAGMPNGYGLFLPGQDPKTADYDYLHPYIVNAGLTLELKLKHVIFVERGKEARGHNLLKLYKELSEKSKEFISSEVDSRTKDSAAHKAISEVAKSQFKIDLGWEVEFLLEKSAYAFERWRYLYETNNSGSWFAGYIEIFDALEKCLTLVRADDPDGSSLNSNVGHIGSMPC